MKHLILHCACCLLFGHLILTANTDNRQWTIDGDQKLYAELIAYDPETNGVKLLIDDTEERILRFNQFSLTDQAWLVEWNEFSNQLEATLSQHGGEFQHFIITGKFTTDLYVYVPLSSMEQGPPPLMILFHPGGKAARYLLRHIEAAEATGMTIVACGDFRNTGDNDAKEAAYTERFEEVLPGIESRVRHDPRRLYMGGSSGGAWRAFHYSAMFSRPWAGIFSNNGWLGGVKYFELPYPSGMRVASVVGNQDIPSQEWILPDTKILERNGSEVGVFSFEGGHQVASPAAQIKAFKWLLYDESVQ